MNRWTALVVLLLLTVSRPTAAATRLAVFIVAEDAQLSNDLTEVAIARLAEKPGYELLGLHELETRLNELERVKEEGIRGCLRSGPCVSEVGSLAGVEQAVVGEVRRDDDRFRLELALVNATTGTTERRVSRQSSLDLDELIGAVQTCVFELMLASGADPAPPTTSAPATEGRAVSRSSGRVPGRDTHQPRKLAEKSIARYVAYGSAALAVVAFSGAAVTGTIGSAKPTGASRAEIQDDLERRQGYASVANGLLVAGGVFTGVAIVGFAISWD